MLIAESSEAKKACDSDPLTGEQLAELRREGFLVVDAPQICQSDIVWCRNILMPLIERGVGRKEGRNLDISAREGGDDGVAPQLCRPSLYASELSKWSYRKTGLAIAKQLLGPEASLSADNAAFKPPRVGGPTPWHQDEAYNDPRHYQEQVTIWIAIFDTTIENGAMAFIPRSHLMGILPHRPNGGAREANSIECCAGFDPKDARVCPIRAGGITIHQGRTVHGASGNKSDTPRLGYILNYKTPPKSRTDLGTFSWNSGVARSIHRRRKYWLLRGGIFVEVWRFLRSDRDNVRHFFIQVAKYFKG
jgi:Phytanoyl-CoA dioxygenase (PhyH)